MRSFAMSALRRAQWPMKYKALDRAFTRNGINPATGKPCKLHRCEACLKEFPKGQMAIDHADPVIPIDHNWEDGPNYLGYDFNQVLARLWVEDGWNVFCSACHDIKSADEKARRAAHKASKS